MPVNETIKIENLSIGYPGKKGPHVVANNITATLGNGEFTCLIGANGAGKSTLLRTLSAFQSPLSGKIYLSEKEIYHYSRSDLASLISVVLTDRCEVNGMTVYELVSMGRTPYTDFWGKLSKDDITVVEQSLELVGITYLSKRRLETLSDGERQKAMIAKALAQETSVILLDEPTAFLDFPSKVEVMQLLRRLSKETDKSILLSTHDLELALQIADKIWLMERTKRLVSGTPEDLSLNGNLSHFFQRKGISFDEKTGLFGVNNTIVGNIRLIGEGERLNMVRKALLRNGISTEETGDSKCVINVTDSDFCLSKDGIIINHSNTIEALLSAVNSQLL